ncbi:MAG: ABC transporter permease [Alphaproteobacteria bacterium 41-28]|nr:MAG: ABC transporter permease [Alphaproteobacteria bacterium 41-28]
MSPSTKNNATFRQMLASIYTNYQLILVLGKREVLGRYRGSIIGLAWSFVNPLLMLIVYTFFFSVVFKARWSINPTQSPTDFAVILFVGLIVYNLFAECINRAPTLITNNVNYVKKIVFPLEILPCVAMGSALFHAVISLFMLLVVQFIIAGSIQWTLIFFPFILAPLVLTTLGISWFLAALGVYVRDIAQMTTFVISVLLFVSPVFYPLSMVPLKFQTIILLNPLTLIIEQSRKVLIFGEIPDWNSLIAYTVCSAFVAWMGFWGFQKTRRGFADVL